MLPKPRPYNAPTSSQMEEKSCDNCIHSEVCKYRDEMDSMMLEWSKMVEDFLKGSPKRVLLSENVLSHYASNPVLCRHWLSSTASTARKLKITYDSEQEG